MRVNIVVSRPELSRSVVAFGFTFAILISTVAFFLAALGYVSLYVGSAIAVILIVFLLWFIYHIVDVKRKYVILTKFAKSIKVSGNTVIFPEPLNVELGYLETIGYWVGYSDRAKSYQRKLAFRTTFAKKNLSELKVEEIPKEFKFAIGFDEAGAVFLPAFRILNPKLKNILVLLVNPLSLKIKLYKNKLITNIGKDITEAHIEVYDRGFKGVVKRFSVDKSRAAKIEIKYNISMLNRVFEVSKVLIRTSEKTKSFDYYIIPDEPLILITFGENISPLMIAKSLDLKPPIVSGVGDYTLRLALEIPMFRDVYDDARVTIA